MKQGECKKVTSKDQLQPSTTPRAPSGPERIYLNNASPGLPGQAGGATGLRVLGPRLLVRVVPFGGFRSPFSSFRVHFPASSISFPVSGVHSPAFVVHFLALGKFLMDFVCILGAMLVAIFNQMFNFVVM